MNSAIESCDDPRFLAAINSADLVTPGGMPIVWSMRLLGVRNQPRVYGPQLMLWVCEAAAREKVPVGLYGGSQETLDLLKKCLAEKYPGLLIRYAVSPPFRKLTAEEQSQTAVDIRQSGCQVLFVGLGSPKQEHWMARHRGVLPVVMLGVGAAFDFISGQKPQAFAWMQALGLEWLFRWCTEPRRLFYRYACRNPRFVLLMAGQLLREFLGKTLRAK